MRIKTQNVKPPALGAPSPGRGWTRLPAPNEVQRRARELKRSSLQLDAHTGATRPQWHHRELEPRSVQPRRDSYFHHAPPSKQFQVQAKQQQRYGPGRTRPDFQAAFRPAAKPPATGKVAVANRLALPQQP